MSEVAKHHSPQGLDIRALVYNTLREMPGLHVAALARESGLAEPSVRYHIQVLVRNGQAIEVNCDPLRRYYPAPSAQTKRGQLGASQKRILGALRRPVPLGMVLHILSAAQFPSMGELADAVNVSPATATYHVRKLEKLGVVHVYGQGKTRLVAPMNPEAVSELLAHYPPSKDMVGSFIDLFDRL